MIDPTRAAGSKARILVVDDHPLVRSGLASLIEQQSGLTCCAQAATGAEAQAAVEKHQPDLVVLDLRLKFEDGLDLIKSLRTRSPQLRILILSQLDPALYAERALRAGALGYVVKEQASDDVIKAIRAVLDGEVYVPRGVAARLLHRFVGATESRPGAGVEQLTNRELQVLQLLGAGMTTKEIATEMKLSFKTIETHRENIKRKLDLDTGAKLVHFATEWVREGITVTEPTAKPPPPKSNS